ncbi:alpha/beta fold hydrolase [Streptomyces caniferus]|uniref:Alpha/beta hydrolase n=1 Tax=Streptomyces caniferus TaxID=285557 RepID=A0A640S8Q1_9ACTN|nr:alpha/beta fold hydrolase [Streptomyces caniferus]GFE07619.1 alpha/beta hydrolase [Streptomyces caniferus]
MSTPSGAHHAGLHYTDQGSGPPVVLVHGVAGGIDTSWGNLLELLAEHHRVIAVDNPGSGNSPLPDGPLQLDTIADSIALTAERAGLEHYTVVGYSMGSAIAVRHAIRYPHRVAALALIAGFACPDPRLRLALHTWRDLLDADARLLGRYLLQQSCGPAPLAQLDHADIDRLAERTAAGLPPGTRRHIDLALSVDVRDDLPHVNAPALVIAAAEDLLVTPSHSDVLAQGIKDSRLIQVLAGHDAPAEQPMAISAHIHALTHR